MLVLVFSSIRVLGFVQFFLFLFKFCIMQFTVAEIHAFVRHMQIRGLLSMDTDLKGADLKGFIDHTGFNGVGQQPAKLKKNCANYLRSPDPEP